MGASISAIEYHFPKNRLSNEHLALEFPNYDFSKFEEKVGIKHRYIVDEGETALDLAVEACKKLFTKHDPGNVDYILYCTQSPEYFLPSTACILQDRLGLKKNVGALDFNLGCSGFTYGVSLAKGLISSGQCKNVLLVTAETYSKYINKGDRSNRAIFGDAAAATLITSSETEKIGNFIFGTDGSGYDKLIVKNGCGKHPFDPSAADVEYGTGNLYNDNNLYMNGPEVFEFTRTVIPPFVEEILKANDVEKDEVASFIFHQANAFMLNFMRKQLKIAKDRFYISLEDGGNTVSNTIPIALKRYAETKHKFDREMIVLTGFGVGLSWSGGVIQLDNAI